MRRMIIATMILGTFLLSLPVTVQAISITTTVDGTQTVYFAGRTLSELQAIKDPAAYYWGDLEDLDTLPNAIDLTGHGPLLSISATGLWSHTPSPNSGPDGYGAPVTSESQYGVFGISLLTANLNSLVGVFLSDSFPDPTSAPAPLTQGVHDMTSPVLNQAFVIGAAADIYVPTYATRLYLGLHNGYEWTNNSGSVAVTITSTPVPEPATILLIGSGLLGLVGIVRRKKFLIK